VFVIAHLLPRAVPARHAHRVGPSGDSVVGELGQVIAAFEHDGRDSGALTRHGEPELLRFAVTAPPIDDQCGIHRIRALPDAWHRPSEQGHDFSAPDHTGRGGTGDEDDIQHKPTPPSHRGPFLVPHQQ